MEHKHFGYWINKAARSARCYDCGCQYQAAAADEAEPWKTEKSA